MNKCEWKQSDKTETDAWFTSCNGVWLLSEGTPKDNDMNYCPYCGGQLKQVIMIGDDAAHKQERRK